MKRTFDRILLFFKNIPNTLKESLLWFLLTYAMPGLQVLIIWGIKQDGFPCSIDVLNIILVSNASLYTAILLVINKSTNDKRIMNALTWISFAATVVFFAISMVEINKGITIFPIALYKQGTLITFLLAILFGLISKYDEVKALSQKTVSDSRSKSSTNINQTEISL